MISPSGGGGCNTRTVLNRSTPQEVYDYTRRMIDIFMKDGGFVFNQEHNIMPDVPPENILGNVQGCGRRKALTAVYLGGYLWDKRKTSGGIKKLLARSEMTVILAVFGVGYDLLRIFQQLFDKL